MRGIRPGALDPGRLRPVPELLARLGLLAAFLVLISASRFLATALTGGHAGLVTGFAVSGAMSCAIVGPAWLSFSSSRAAGLRGIPSALVLSAYLLLPFAVSLAGGIAPAGAGTGWIGALLALLPAAAAEEIGFRGYLQDALAYRGRLLPASIISSVLFAAVHSGNPAITPLGLFNIGLFGFLLCRLRTATGGLQAPILVHWLWNGVTGVVLGAQVSGYRLPSLLEPSSPPPWGGFGPEGSAALTAVLVSALIGMHLATGRKGRAGTGPAPA